jgi:uncharacterized protein YcbK (DUF882 family)
MMQLAKNFNLSEFECNCGCEMPEEVFANIKELAPNLQIIRDEIGKSIRITNAYRCPSKNKAVGGAEKSQHLLGKAADLQVKDMTPGELADVIEALQEQGKIAIGGLGRYNTFTHYDIRGTIARWDNT